MATVAYTAFLPEVLPNVPGCADIVAINAIRNATIDLLERSLAFKETQDAQVVAPADFPMDIEAPSGMRVVAVTAVQAGGVPLDPVTHDAVSTSEGGVAQTGSPIGYYMPTPETVTLDPLPNASVSLVLTVACTPTRASTGVESWVYQRHLEEIASGALARLLAQPMQPWSNPDLASFHLNRFENAVSRLRISAMKSFGKASLIVKPRMFGE